MFAEWEHTILTLAKKHLHTCQFFKIDEISGLSIQSKLDLKVMSVFTQGRSVIFRVDLRRFRKIFPLRILNFVLGNSNFHILLSNFI